MNTNKSHEIVVAEDHRTNTENGDVDDILTRDKNIRNDKIQKFFSLDKKDGGDDKDNDIHDNEINKDDNNHHDNDDGDDRHPQREQRQC
jgi:hypothetical protein